MNRKNLIDAFGDIDEEMFAYGETDLSDCGDGGTQPLIVYGGGKKMNKKPIFAAGAAVCAAIAAVSIPLVMKGGGEYPLSTGTGSEIGSLEVLTEEITEASTEEITTAEETTVPLLTLPYDEDFQYELYVKDKEIFDAEELYDVDVKDIDIEKFNEAGSNIDVLYISRFYGDLVCLEGDDLYYSETVHDPAYDARVNSEHEEWGAVYKYNLVTEETIVVFTEKADEDYGLLIKIAAVEGDWIYYYRDRCRNGMEENYIELWRCNMTDGRKEKMLDIGETYYRNVKAAVKSGRYLYFYYLDDSFFTARNYYIYCYDTEKERSELLKKDDLSLHGLYKDGIIYGIGNDFYYHKNGEPFFEDEFLFNAEDLFELDRYYQSRYGIYTLGEKLMYSYDRDDGTIRISEYGYLDDNFLPHKLITAKGDYWWGGETESGLVWLDFTVFEHSYVFYDSGLDRFSSLTLPYTKKLDRDVGCLPLKGTDDEIRFIMFECSSPNRTEYYWVRLYTVRKK